MHGAGFSWWVWLLILAFGILVQMIRDRDQEITELKRWISSLNRELDQYRDNSSETKAHGTGGQIP